jgi:hypothetical protein
MQEYGRTSVCCVLSVYAMFDMYRNSMYCLVCEYEYGIYLKCAVSLRVTVSNDKDDMYL